MVALETGVAEHTCPLRKPLLCAQFKVSPSDLHAAATPTPLRLPHGWIPAAHFSARDVEKRGRGKKVVLAPKRKREDDSMAAWICVAAKRVAGWRPGAAFREMSGARVPGESGNMIALWDGALAPVHVAVGGGKTEALRVFMAARDRDPVNDVQADAGEGDHMELKTSAIALRMKEEEDMLKDKRQTNKMFQWRMGVSIPLPRAC
ncbi:hypothetical protein HDU96_011062 [Phlyctochytrium bullatum]|nr:hypothetical protein HDU96_011062 [Phlyctochytrium bullatum]